MHSNGTHGPPEPPAAPDLGAFPPPYAQSSSPAPHPPRAPKRGKATVVAVSVLVGALALAGTGTALALTNSWPFSGLSAGTAGSGPAHTAGGAEAAVSFADGAEEKWTLQGSDLHPDGLLAGSIPRMLGPINEAKRADQPIQLNSGVLVNYLTREGRGEIPSAWALVDAETGEPIWNEPSTGYPTSCATSPDGAEAVCNEVFIDNSQRLIAFDEHGVRLEEDSGTGSVRYSATGYELLSESAIEKYAPGGTLIGTSPVQGLFAGAVGNARTPDCVWLEGAGTVSYVGTGCDAPADEVLMELDAFTWGMVGVDDPVLLIASETAVTAFDARTRARLWELEGTVPGRLQAPQLVQLGSEQGLLASSDTGDGWNYSIVGLRSGVEIPLDHTGVHAVVVANEVLVFDALPGSGSEASTISSVEVFDGATGKRLSAFDIPRITNVAQITGGPLGVMIGHPKCTGCSTAEGSHIIESYTFLGPASGGGGAAIRNVSDVQIPRTIPATCPADTILLAWAELPDGWVLVCGITLGEPSYLVYQPAEGGARTYSKGATQPTSAEATGALRWDDRLSRYTAQMSNGTVLTLDYDIGTLTVRDSADARTADQQRLVRYIFVVIGNGVRTVEDVSKDTGAFAVQAPGESAEDQIRYMIEVLEKAYAGRALVKDALPKLENCTASAGGYGDSIATMKAVRDNRAELLDALDAMPVDRIPQGQRLLDELVDAIRHSHAANLEYVAWAESADATGCASLSAAGRAEAKASDGPKEAFAALWNSAVAAKYGVRTFDAWFI